MGDGEEQSRSGQAASRRLEAVRLIPKFIYRGWTQMDADKEHPLTKAAETFSLR